MSLILLTIVETRHERRSCVFEEQENRNKTVRTVYQEVTYLIFLMDEEDGCEAFGSDMYLCLECTSLPDQQQQFLFPNRDQISVDASDGFEGDMSSIIECISQSVQQSESLDSNVPVMRLRGGAFKKKRRRIETFQGSSSQ
jgi:hypothetical protein